MTRACVDVRGNRQIIPRAQHQHCAIARWRIAYAAGQRDVAGLSRMRADRFPLSQGCSVVPAVRSRLPAPVFKFVLITKAPVAVVMVRS